MDSLVSVVSAQFKSWLPGELVAVILAVLYLLLAIRQNIWCWVCAGISTAIYVFVYFGAKLYMESALNVFYFIMAIYGWSIWRSGERQDTDGDNALPVAIWPVRVHLVAVGIVVVLAGFSGYLLGSYTNAAFPYIDSATTFAAIWATFLVARKVLENWWYWLAIDVASVMIYWSRDLQLTSLLFVLYVVMIPFGLISWTRSWRQQQELASI
jgi:nicotinamide mononucleotide transporter